MNPPSAPPAARRRRTPPAAPAAPATAAPGALPAASADRAAPSSAVAPGFKSRGGLARIWRAATYSWAGLRAAVRHEAAFRQELAIGLPLIAFAWWAAPGRWQALALTASIALVWLVELVNSAIEALADAVSADAHPLLGRAKDLGSAAVMLAIGVAALTWGVVFWP